MLKKVFDELEAEPLSMISLSRQEEYDQIC